MTLDARLMEMLRCPDCHGTFAAPSVGESDVEELVCTGCGKAYPVRNGVPVLLVDEARLPNG